MANCHRRFTAVLSSVRTPSDGHSNSTSSALGGAAATLRLGIAIVCRLSVSVTFVHPTPPVDIAGNVSTPFSPREATMLARHGDRNFVRLSVRTRVLCDETKQHTAEMLTPHERLINQVF